MTKPLNISESAAVQMPMKTVASLIVLVAMGVFAYTEVTARLTSLETSRELFNADLLKKSEQKPTDQEQFMLILMQMIRFGLNKLEQEELITLDPVWKGALYMHLHKINFTSKKYGFQP